MGFRTKMLNHIHVRFMICALIIFLGPSIVSGSAAGSGCCPRKLNNGTIYKYFDFLADPSDIEAEYGCHTGCLYEEEDGDSDDVFCFKENGDYLSQCIAGTTIASPVPSEPQITTTHRTTTTPRTTTTHRTTTTPRTTTTTHRRTTTHRTTTTPSTITTPRTTATPKTTRTPITETTHRTTTPRKTTTPRTTTTLTTTTTPTTETTPTTTT